MWTLSNVKTFFEIAAYLAAAFFFLYKVVSGYLITNMSVRIGCNRQSLEGTSDLLAVTLTLLKGNLGSVRIHDVVVRSNVCRIPEMTDFRKQLWRLGYKTNTQEAGHPLKILLDTRSISSPFINLGPGEETQFASYSMVPKTEVCHIDAVLVGRRIYGRAVCQWRISTVSFPVK